MRGYRKWTVAGFAIATLATAVVVGLTGVAGQAAPAPARQPAVQPVAQETGVPISVMVGEGTTPTPTPTPTQSPTPGGGDGGNGGPLPRTGTDVMTLAGFGLLLVVAGSLAVFFGRRRAGARNQRSVTS